MSGIVDQAAIKAGFDFRRYAMKPMPAKPRIIMAQVEGSGTAVVRVDSEYVRKAKSLSPWGMKPLYSWPREYWKDAPPIPWRATVGEVNTRNSVVSGTTETGAQKRSSQLPLIEVV